MASERWERIAQLYHSACEQPATQRSAFLAEACQGDAELRREGRHFTATTNAKLHPGHRFVTSREGLLLGRFLLPVVAAARRRGLDPVRWQRLEGEARQRAVSEHAAKVAARSPSVVSARASSLSLHASVEELPDLAQLAVAVQEPVFANAGSASTERRRNPDHLRNHLQRPEF